MDYDDWYDGAEDRPMEGCYDDQQDEPIRRSPQWRGRGRGGRGGYRTDRYSNAYEGYNGGYGPSGALGPHGGFGPPCPPSLIGYPPPIEPNYSSWESWGAGFGPLGPPIRRKSIEDKALRYLQRCGVPRESLKNLPFGLLKLYDPQECGLCGHTFDSFSTSRMHYLSKNHAKSQKKWLSKQSEGGQRYKEIPIKARELYCELCDVHITSKVHADSHYAGKPHRSIVEGRKNPKNPMLLQKHMAERMEQLIRREKKFMKPLEDTQEGEEPAEPKVIPPEFYCEICKTGVTCSEQMTMHLNGKRHLAKEKAHILRMMKGEATGTAGNDEKDVPEADDIEEDKEEAEVPEGGKDKYDWGNGSGNWEESAAE